MTIPHFCASLSKKGSTSFSPYDYEQAALILTMTNDLTPWKAVGVEIETRDGQHVIGHHVSCQDRRLVLLENTQLREKDVVRITFKAEHLDA